MDAIGTHIVEMQELLNTIIAPCPAWLPAWRKEAEHVLFLAHEARRKEDHEKLKVLDQEARSLVEKRKAKPPANQGT